MSGGYDGSGPQAGGLSLGRPRHHLDEVGSTNDVARNLARDGASHGTTVTAARQTAGRGRQGRAWVAPEGQALTVSVVLRDLPQLPLLPLAAAVAVAETAGATARIKWPNDVVFVDQREGSLRKVAGILCEARPGEGWAIVGIGLNVAVDVEALPDDVRARAASMGRRPDELEVVLDELLERLAVTLALDPWELLDRWRSRDVLRGRTIGWTRPGSETETPATGVVSGIDDNGNLRVRVADGTISLNAGDVHLVL